MARSRNIKPGLFKNEVLGEADPDYVLLFAGLWTLADKEGRLEYRPKRIKAEIFPYRDVDVCKALAWLMHESFITVYKTKHESEQKSYIQVSNWRKHQSPHHKESNSTIPPMSKGEKCVVNQDGTLACAMHESSMIQEDRVNPPDSLNSDSLNSDSLNSDTCASSKDEPCLSPSAPESSGDDPDKSLPDKPTPTRANYSEPSEDIFQHWVTRMGKSPGKTKFTKERRKRVVDRLKDGYTADQVKTAIDGCANSPHHMGQNEQGTVYDDLELICRNATKLEGFIAKASMVPPRSKPQEAEDSLAAFVAAVSGEPMPDKGDSGFIEGEYFEEARHG